MEIVNKLLAGIYIALGNDLISSGCYLVITLQLDIISVAW